MSYRHLSPSSPPSRSRHHRSSTSKSHRRTRSRSPQPHHHRRHRQRTPPLSQSLPFQAPQFSKHDFEKYKGIFGLYLEVQKKLFLEELEEKEARGRWRSFMGRWNRGELAEGWYDPATSKKANDDVRTSSPAPEAQPPASQEQADSRHFLEDSSEDDGLGPALPGGEVVGHTTTNASRLGPTVPSLQDLELKRELDVEDSVEAREALRTERKLTRKAEKECLEELVSRAAAGTKDRMLEKKREKAEANRAFATSKTDTGAIAEIPDADLLGDDGGVESFKMQRKELALKKNEREIRREEVMRARAEEREERVKQYKMKEEATMKGLVELAKARFG